MTAFGQIILWVAIVGSITNGLLDQSVEKSHEVNRKSGSLIRKYLKTVKTNTWQMKGVLPLKTTYEIVPIGTTNTNIDAFRAGEQKSMCTRLCGAESYIASGYNLSVSFFQAQNPGGNPNQGRPYGSVYAPNKFLTPIAVNWKFDGKNFDTIPEIIVQISVGDLGADNEICFSIAALAGGFYNYQQRWTKNSANTGPPDPSERRPYDASQAGPPTGEITQFAQDFDGERTVNNFESLVIHTTFCESDSNSQRKPSTFVVTAADTLSAFSSFVCNYNKDIPDEEQTCDYDSEASWVGKPDRSQSSFNIVQDDDLSQPSTGDVIWGVVGWGGNPTGENKFHFAVRSGSVLA